MIFTEHLNSERMCSLLTHKSLLHIDEKGQGGELTNSPLQLRYFVSLCNDLMGVKMSRLFTEQKQCHAGRNERVHQQQKYIMKWLESVSITNNNRTTNQ